MPDPRPQHFHYPKTLLNQPTPPYEGPGKALYGYGPRGPTRDHNRPLSEPPESIADHIDQAIRKVPGLNPRQRLALHNTLTAMSRDISYIRMVASQAHHMGPHSEAATHIDSQGNPVS
jgi:hypothetical protein